MKKKFDRVYQFKIFLKDIKPPVWRRIQVPENYTFWDLHVAIQDAMGWRDCHLHQFELINPSTGFKNVIRSYEGEEFDDDIVELEGLEKISEWFSIDNRIAHYEYDFGDGWLHTVRLEKILPRDKNVSYPICIAGKRACPPEDCGGVWGYEELLEILRDKNHPEYEDMIAWVRDQLELEETEEFNSEHFDPKEVTFDDPDKRFKIAFG